MKHVVLPCGESVAALGQGTWNIGDDPARRRDEIATLQRGIELGLTLIDTAEMYGDGRSESLVGEAIAGRRAQVYIVSKVYPHNASRKAMPRSCEVSLGRLGVEAIDLYLLHWEGSVPLAETVEAFEALQRQGKIRHWGVSNLDTELMRSLWEVPGGRSVQTDQVLYNLARRGPEYDLIPWCRGRRMPLMVYSPVDHGRLLQHRAVRDLAAEKGVTAAQLAIAWVLRLPDVFAVAKASTRAHVIENRAALEIDFSQAELDQLDRLFPPPFGKVPLDVY